MRILAIETVELTGSVAAIERDQLLAELPLEPGQRSAQSLAPGIQRLLSSVAWKSTDVQLVAVATGPGSFTGLRIGVTTAKAFAYAVGCEVLGVHTLLSIASRVPPEVLEVSVVLDAQRGELFATDAFRQLDGTFAERDTTQIIARDKWLAGLQAGQIVTGPGLSKIAAQLPSGVIAVERAFWAPTASSIGQLAERQFSAGVRESVFGLLPRYFRRTAAEEQWDRKHPG